MNWQYKPLGEILVRTGLITEDQMNQSLAQQEQSGRPLGELLIKQGFLSEDDLARALARQKKLEIVDLSKYAIDPRASALISQKEALKNQLIPIDFSGGRLVVATANPLDIQALDNIGLITGYKITPVVATGSAIKESISQFIPADSSMAKIVDLAAEDLFTEEDDIESLAKGAPIVRLANSLISEAVRKRASDIHIEAKEKSMFVRFRIDGVLQEHSRLPKRLLGPLISRLKIMSEIDIAEKRLPQDGRTSLIIDGKGVDIRMATLPSIKGENLNMRILERDRRALSLSELGMAESMLDQFKKCFTKANGTALVTGPTGSGKTTSLYAALSILNSPERKIITIEDPVERSFDGITQMQINPKSGLTFAGGLRAILRHDPDVVMVGEIRDVETAKIAIRAAMTGHFVLSTLHTNDSASTITRLLDMGIEPFLAASSIRSILAQRLARRLCEHCKQPYLMKPVEAMKAYGVDPSETEITFFKPVGCRKCNDTGYHGRVAIFELLIMNEDIGKLCLKQASAAEIRRLAVSKGMITLRRDAFNKARQGITSLEEISRVLA